MDREELLLRLHESEIGWSRHHEEQRSTVSGILLAIDAGIISAFALFSPDGRLFLWSPLTNVAATMLLFFSTLGVLLSAKHYERFRFHQSVSVAYRKEIDAINNGKLRKASTESLRDRGKRDHRDNFSFFNKPRWYLRHRVARLHLHTLWIWIHGLVAFAASAYLVAGVFNAWHP